MNGARRAGASDAPVSGERLEAERRGRKKWIIGSTFAVGLVVGFAVGFREGDEMVSGAGSAGWPPAMAIAIVLSYLIAVFGGGWLLSRHTDEFERLAQYKAVAFAALTYVIVYPVWFALWMGDLVREPMHAVLFVVFWLSLAAASLFYRLR